MTNTEPLDLDAIEARANAASSGPWRMWNPSEGPSHIAIGTKIAWESVASASTFRDDERIPHWADANFIAHAREDVPALIAEVRRLRGLTIGADDDSNVDTCWAVVLDDCGSADLYETREEADAARAKAPDTGLDYIVTTTIVPATPEETR